MRSPQVHGGFSLHVGVGSSWGNYSFRYKTFHTVNSKLSRPVTWYLHGDLEDPEEPERPEHGQAEGARLGLEVRPDLLEGGERYDEGVEAVEGGLHVDADAQRPHPQQHLEDEQPEEHEFGSVCGGERSGARFRNIKVVTKTVT